MTTTANLDSPSVRLDPGDEAVVPVHIRNNGDTVEGYDIKVVGVPSAWAVVDPPTLSLYPGASTTATVTFRPPRTYEVPAGRLQFGVVVLPTDHPDESVTPEGVIELLPFLETVAELIPRTSQGSRRGRHQVAVDNRGNVAVPALLSGADDSNQVEVRVSPSGVTVGAGEARFVNVHLSPRRRLWRGSPVTHPFIVEVAPQDSTAVTLAGTYVQTALIPKWLPRLLLALLALLLALVALWFFVLKPTIESQAKEVAEEAVADDVAAAEDSADAANDSAGDAKDAEKGAKDSEDDARKILKQPEEQEVTPLATRISSLGTNVYTVPRSQTLTITDLVLSNPQGDFGRVVVTAGGDELFESALENFRDLDYHFVTPIEVEQLQTVTLEVLCREPGKPPGAPAAASCDIGLFIGGELSRPTPDE